MIEFFRSIYYWLATGLASVVSLVFYPCQVIGRGNVPRQGGFILASNHESNIDPMLLPVVCPRQMRFMAKDSLFSNPVLGAIIRTGGGFPVKRGRPDRGAMEEFLRQLSLGFPVLIFPQGTRGGERPQAGVGFLAVKSGKPVLPVYIEGTDKVLAKGKALPQRHPVKVVFGTPITFGPDEPVDVVAQKVMAAIWALKNPLPH
ncbi:MAG: 1-acyl-sn-glycerol-3-phosphate acyltransferase [Candidatus Omnitrophica bacterium]|nr:1-acyl-sn-glycerol-3-phosphate acyltransferase [Candidatus Omnitrophota bacterium]